MEFVINYCNYRIKVYVEDIFFFKKVRTFVDKMKKHTSE